MAVTTKGALLFGKVVDLVTPVKNTIRVLAPKITMNKIYQMYLRKTTEVYAYDPDNQCRPGDFVIIRELPEPVSLLVNHKLEKVVYKVGHMVDPVTGLKCIGTRSIQDVDSLSETFGQKPKYRTELFSEEQHSRL